MHPQAAKVTVILDNLSTHKKSAFYNFLTPTEAKAMADRFEFIYTPKHGSWLNMAEIELRILKKQCLSKRMPDKDTMQVQVRYANDVLLNYTLCAYSPWEGLEIKFHGTKGELTHKHIEVHGVFGGQRDKSQHENMTTTLHLAGERPRNIDVWQGEGDHGGADPVMLGYLFNPAGMEPDRYNRASSHKEGAWSILTGIAANAAMARGETIHVDALLAEAGITLAWE